MKDTEIRTMERLTELYKIVEVARFNGLQTMGDLMAFYDRMKQGNETLGETLARHTREVLGVE